MSEKESHSPMSWQPEAIAQRLNTEALPENDGSYGDDVRFRFGTEQRFCLTVYPQSETVISRSGTHEWRMAHQQPPVIDEDGVRFTDEADGSSTLFTATESGVGIAAAAFPGSEVMEASTYPRSLSFDVSPT